MTARIERSFGCNVAYFEPPDLLIVHFDHTQDVPAAQVLIGMIYELGDAHGPLDLIVVIGKQYTSNPAVRGVYSQAKRKYPIRFAAVVGASFAIKVLASMGLRAGRTLAPGRFDFPVEFFDTEEEARARIAALRA